MLIHLKADNRKETPMKAMKMLRSICFMLLIFALLCSCAAVGFAAEEEKGTPTLCGETHIDLETWHEGDGTHYAFCYACKTEIIGQQCVIETVDEKVPQCTTDGYRTEACVGGINPVSGKIDRNAHTLNGGCDYSSTLDLPPSHEQYTNNGNGTHTISCTCDTGVNGKSEEHGYINGTCVYCNAAHPGTLLDFRAGSPETGYRWNVNSGTASVDAAGNGFLNGEINGKDPYVDMDHNNVFKRIAHPIATRDVVQLRVKLSLNGVDTTGARYGVYLGFAAGAEYWKEGGFAAVTTTDAQQSSDGYVIVTIPLKEFVGRTVQYIRVDFMEWQNETSFTGSYSIDYIYLGQQSNTPTAVTSSQNTLLDFKEGSREVTRFNWLAHNMSISFDGKYGAYMQGTINGTDPYVGMDTTDEANVVNHLVREGDIVKVRVKLSLNEREPLGTRYGFYLGFASGDAYLNGGIGYNTTTDYQESSGGYVIVTCPVPEDRVGQTMKYVRLDFVEWDATTHFTGSFSLDYFYIGNPCDAPGAQHSWDQGSLTTAPSCIEMGIRTYTCTACKATKTETVATTGHTTVTDKAVAATCTTDGKTEGSHCSVCSTVFQAQTTVPATGHNYSYTPVDALLHTGICGTCSSRVEAEHSFENGFCICGQTEAKEPVLLEDLVINHTLNLASDISINFAIAKSQLVGFDMSTVSLECSIGTYEGNVQTGTSTVTLLPEENGNYYYFTFTGLNAVMMNDNINAVFHGTKNGISYFSAEDVYSVASYAYSQLSKGSTSDKLKTLCANLLRYGSSAQIFKGYRTNALVDAKMTAEQKRFLTNLNDVAFDSVNTTSSEISNATVTWVGKALSLDSKVTIKYIVDLSKYTGNIADLSLHINYYDINGERKTVVLTDPVIYNAAKNQYAFDFDGLLAAELRQTVVCAVYNGNTRLSSILQYSVSTYGSGKTGALNNLCRALLAYSDAAKSYFLAS